MSFNDYYERLEALIALYECEVHQARSGKQLTHMQQQAKQENIKQLKFYLAGEGK